MICITTSGCDPFRTSLAIACKVSMVPTDCVASLEIWRAAWVQFVTHDFNRHNVRKIALIKLKYLR